MAAINDDTFSGDEEYSDMVVEILRGFNDGTHRIRRVNGHFACNFCLSRRVREWSLLNLLDHANGHAGDRSSISGPQHKALADYILTSPAMAREHELDRVGDCGGNTGAKAERARVHATNHAKTECKV